ncbi:hypothetical protein SAMN05428938_5159 [Streptomyces sp. KS_5]|nr:hypothetical protein SAMN05428938_5159 [Streptomyces sp. KS_5]
MSGPSWPEGGCDHQSLNGLNQRGQRCVMAPVPCLD